MSLSSGHETAWLLPSSVIESGMGQESVCKKVKMLVYKYLGTYLVWAHGISSGRMVRCPVWSATPLARLTSGWCGVIRVSNSNRALDGFGLDRKSSDETGEGC